MKNPLHTDILARTRTYPGEFGGLDSLHNLFLLLISLLLVLGLF